MKKYKLLKGLFIVTPLLATPVIANSCSNNNKANSKYYVDIFANEWQATVENQQQVFDNIATSATNSASISDLIKDTIVNAQTDVIESKNVPSNYNANEFKNITISGESAYSQYNKKNNEYFLTVFPPGINDTSSAGVPLNTNISLTIGKNKYSKQVINYLDVAKGFKTYNQENGINPPDTHQVAISSARSAIYAATSNGIKVGVRQSNGAYTFNNFAQLNNQIVNGISLDNNEQVYAATNTGVWIAKRVKTSVTAVNYNKANTSDGIADDTINAIYANPDGSTVYVANDAGISVGVKGTGDTYTFTNYGGLMNNTLARSLFVTSDGTIYVGTTNGMYILTKKTTGTGYDAKQVDVATGEANNEVLSLFVDQNKTIYAGTKGEFAIGKIPTGKENYEFTQQAYPTGVTGDVFGVTASSDGKTIYYVTGTHLVSGTLNGGEYTYADAGVTQDSYYNSIYMTSDQSTIYIGFVGGLLISSTKWIGAS